MAKITTVAQNFDIYEGDGLSPYARTGATSANQILSAGAEGVILGHSEVGDSPEVVNKKLQTIVASGEVKGLPTLNLTVLIGESWEEFEGNNEATIAATIKRQCETVFDGVAKEALQQLTIGYEPKWGSRGSGRDDMPPPQPTLISACIEAMRNFVREKYGDEVKPLFIYGGRSTPERTKEILSDENVDGLILGSACNTVEKTLGIASAMEEVREGLVKVLICNFKAYDLPDAYEKYVDRLKELGEDFVVILAPAHTDIRAVRSATEARA
ncbi:hypothetical protein HOG48_04865 [Candidatus Peregrinibacteria bacterium]|jgi:triosephosphate isomerase (TIM)|nr:hypothetical protein [Candidatus Peregrinibacteria bacterium]